MLGNSLPYHFISRESSSPYLFSLQLQHTESQLLFETTEEKPMGFVTGSSASSDKDLPNTVIPSLDVPDSCSVYNYSNMGGGWGMALWVRMLDEHDVGCEFRSPVPMEQS